MKPCFRLEASGVYDLTHSVYTPGGCITWDDTGYLGRLCAAEVLIIDEDIRNKIRACAFRDQIRDFARNRGFRALQQDAWHKG